MNSVIDQIPGPQEGVLPFYLLVDESGSMDGAPIDTINQSVKSLFDVVSASVAVSQRAYVAFLGFSTDASELLPLMDLGQARETDIPVYSAKNETNYGEAFKLLRAVIERDCGKLKSLNMKVFRPLIFFISDGQPTDPTWESDLAAVHDQTWSYHPNILSFGLGNVDAQVMTKIATKRAYVQTDSSAPMAELLSKVFETITYSIVTTASKDFGASGPQIEIPREVPGFDSFDAEVV